MAEATSILYSSAPSSPLLFPPPPLPSCLPSPSLLLSSPLPSLSSPYPRMPCWHTSSGPRTSHRWTMPSGPTVTSLSCWWAAVWSGCGTSPSSSATPPCPPTGTVSPSSALTLCCPTWPSVSRPSYSTNHGGRASTPWQRSCKQGLILGDQCMGCGCGGKGGCACEASSGCVRMVR